jgi:hypothetical protein
MKKLPAQKLRRYSRCVAENEENSPWIPYHVDMGYNREKKE